ncbi:MAG TPA: SUMF1/EgtB/PvdO family nonheme iron enzyme [Polyangiaceae bacterium]|nr:SUMF1/EgtB/PvdO family nonheme iron enzyme [Polyangiaceae bacterium]
MTTSHLPRRPRTALGIKVAKSVLVATCCFSACCAICCNDGDDGMSDPDAVAGLTDGPRARAQRDAAEDIVNQADAFEQRDVWRQADAADDNAGDAVAKPSLDGAAKDVVEEQSKQDDSSGRCPEGMVYVEGDYCMTVTHQCTDSLADKTAVGALGFDDQCIAYVPGSSKCGTARKKVSVHLKVVPGDKHDQDRADTKHAFGKKFLGAKAGDVINGCTVERILGFGRDSAVPGSIVQLDCPSVIRLAFCMDRYEYPNQPGATPARLASWYEAQETCEAAGKRLCEEQEWTLACEGPERQPYPTGWTRGIWTADTEESRSGCNISRCYSNCLPKDQDANGRCTEYDPLLKRQASRPACYTEPKWISQQLPGQSEETKKKYFDMVDRASGDPNYPFLLPSGSMSQCVSPYGVFDLTGNVDEWVQSFDYHESKISNLKGGHYLHNCRARCRPVTTQHGPFYVQASIGFRCCADPR